MEPTRIATNDRLSAAVCFDALVFLSGQVPGQAMPGQPVQGQPMPGQPVQGQAMPGQAMPGQPAMRPAQNNSTGTADGASNR